MFAIALLFAFSLNFEPGFTHYLKNSKSDFLLVPPEANSSLVSFSGGLFEFLVTGKQTDNQLAVYEFTAPAGLQISPHLHTREGESFYILEGEWTFQLDDSQTVNASAGTFLHLPANRSHAFTTLTDAKVLAFVTPGGFDEFVAQAGVPIEDPSDNPFRPVQNPELIAQLATQYGIVFFPNPGSYTPVEDYIVVKPDTSGSSFRLEGGTYTSLAMSAQTNGTFSLFDVVLPPQARSGLPKSNEQEVESFYVLNGEVTFEIGGQTRVVTPGSYIYFPKGSTYTFQNLETTSARLLLLQTR